MPGDSVSPGGGRPPPVQIAVLGPLDIQIGDPPRELRSVQQRMLLVRLALADGRPVSVDRLVADLWPRTRPRDATHALHAHVSRLRRSLTGHAIESGPGGYRLAPERLDVDAFQFTAFYDQGVEALRGDQPQEALRAFDHALALWRGDPLDDLQESDELRPFIVRMIEMRRTAVAHRIEAHLAAGAADTVLPELRSAVAADPLDERSWRQLLLALHQGGRSRDALESYREAHQIFIDELGIEPGAMLRHVHQSILEGVAPSDHREITRESPESDGSARPRVANVAAQRLIGRARELELIERVWTDSVTGHRIVAVTGEPGIGKTRLVTDFAAQARAAGVRVLTARCDPAHSRPYAAISQLVHGVTDDARLHRAAADLLTGILPDLDDRAADPVDAAPAWDPVHDQHRTMDQIVRWLAVVASAQPTIVVVDDVHWADEQTLRLLEYLVHSDRTIGALVLLTFRDGQLEPSRTAPGVLRQSPALTRLRLQPLAAGETVRLLQDETDGLMTHELPERLVSWGASVSGGNPLFVVELARRFASGGSTSLPTVADLGVEDVIRARLDPLPELLHRLLEQAAILGTEFDPTLLRLMSDRTEDEIDSLLSVAAQQGLVGAGSGATIAFRHEIVRAVLYESLPPLRRASGHWCAVRALESRHAGNLAAVASELAHHSERAQRSDGTELAVHYHRLAASEAMHRRAPRMAVEYLERALGLLPATTGTGRRCDLLTDLSRAQLRAAVPAYRNTLLQAAQLATEIGDPDRLAHAVIANSRGWWSSTAQLDHERVATIEHALRVCDPGDRAMQVRLLSAWARETVRDPNNRDLALARSQRALTEAEALGDEQLLALTLSNRYTVLYASLGDTAECLVLNERLLEIAHRRGDPGLRLSATVGLTQSALTLGELAIADRHLDHAAQLAESLDQPVRLWLLRGWQAMRRALAGDLVDAFYLAQETRDLGARTQQPDAATWFAGQVFTFRLLQGRLPELLDDVSSQAGAHAFGIPSWRAAMALTLAHAGDLHRAEQIVEELARDNFAALPRDILWLQGMSYLSGTCELLGRDDLAGPLYTALAPYSGHLAHNGTIDAGPVDLHLGRMAQLTGAGTTAHYHLDAARRLCHRIGAPLWLARIDEPVAAT